MTDISHDAQASNEGHLIERAGGAQAEYLSEKVGRDFGAPFNGWVTDRETATVYQTREQAQVILDTALAHVAPFCAVVAK